MSEKILIVDDEEDMVSILERTITSERDCEVIKAKTGLEALEILSKRDVDLILADMRMPEMGGLELLDSIKEKWPGKTVIIITAYGSVDTAVEAMKKGAYDFLTKPFDSDNLLIVIKRALERARLLDEKRNLLLMLSGRREFVGKSDKMRKVFETIKSVASSSAPVLITGESGTGKELAAIAIHSESRRSKGRFVAINCAAIPETIIESEFFGYKRGAFTGAIRDKKGLIEEADGGTLFLDEVGDLNLYIQAKLLRVLQEGEFRPVGDVKDRRANLRVISATNKNLETEVRKGNFREDLFYRLKVVSIHIPSLGEREDDIPLLAAHFVKKYSDEYGKGTMEIAPSAMAHLIRRRWQGNVREMENVIARAVALSNDSIIDETDLSEEGAVDADNTEFRAAKKRALMNFYKTYISSALIRNKGNISKTAEECSMMRQSLQQIMKRCGINPDDFR